MAGIFRKWEMCTTLNQINCFVFIERILSFINVKKVLWTKKCKIWCKMEYESSPKQKCCNKNFLWISLWMTLHRRFFFNKLKFIIWTSHLKQKQNRKKIIIVKVTFDPSSYLEKAESTELQAFKRQKDGYNVTVVIYDSKRWRQVGTPCIFHSRWQVNFSGLWVRLKMEQHKYTIKYLQWLYNHPFVFWKLEAQ